MERKEARRIYLAHAGAIARDVSLCAERLKQAVADAAAHTISEEQLLETIHAELFGLPIDSGLAVLTSKLVTLKQIERENRVE